MSLLGAAAGWFTKTALPWIGGQLFKAGVGTIANAASKWLSPAAQSSGQAASHAESTSWGGSNDAQNWDWAQQAANFNQQSADRRWQQQSIGQIGQMGFNALGSGLSYLANRQAMKDQQRFNAEQQKLAMDYNSAQAAMNRDFQERMASTQYQRAVKDLRAAGLNPILAYTNGGAAVPAGAMGAIGGGASSSALGMSAPSASGISGAQASMTAPNSWSQGSSSVSDYYMTQSMFYDALARVDTAAKKVADTDSKVKKQAQKQEKSLESQIKEQKKNPATYKRDYMKAWGMP